jgi:PAS domain S-box-containing protein
MKFYLNRKFLLGFVVSILILATLGISSFLYIRNVIDLGKRGSREQRILFLSERVRSLTTERESFIRDLRSSNNPALVKSYAELSGSIQQVMNELTSSTRDDAPQSRNILRLSDEIFHSDSREPMTRGALLSSNSTRLDTVKFYIDRIQSTEVRARLDRQAQATDQFYQFVFTYFGLVLVGLTVPITLAIALNKNLRERTMAEEKLSKASQTIQDLYENAPCGYFSLNKDGIITHVNNTLVSLLGYSRGELVDRMQFTTLLSATQRPVYDNVFSELRDKGQVHDVEFMIQKKDKSLLPTSINAISIADHGGNFVSSRCTLFDITELKRAELETQKANQELEAFSYSVSHDLRAPLRSINGFARIMSEDYGKILDDEGNRLMGKIIKNANRMGLLIDDLLSFARLGKKEIKKGEVNLDDFVRGIANNLIDQEKSRAIHLTADPLGKCFADESMLEQVWVNLISNALKYSRKSEQTEIHIGAFEQEHERIFFVKDNGVGFDMKFSGKIFGVFQRLHRPEDFDGTGVGLALVKRIVERHHGRIWFKAELNKGATFFFTIGPPNLKPMDYAIGN